MNYKIKIDQGLYSEQLLHKMQLTQDFRPESEKLRKYIDNKKTFYFFKRFFDVLISGAVTVFILTWLIPILAISIKISSRGPVFFTQRRVGKGGKSFTCLKFRTMVVNHEANSLQAQKNDVRITKLGNFLRKSNLDEFPQFLNVLMGDMSLVGPRPHMHVDCAKFSNVVDKYKFRNMVRPGISGLAQVKGFRGPTADFKSIFHRYQFDAFYVRNASMGLDIRIVKQTITQTFSYIFNKLIGRDLIEQKSLEMKTKTEVFNTIGFTIKQSPLN